LGGYAMTASALSGQITLTFRDRRDDAVAFELDHGSGLNGSDSVLSAPDGYSLRSTSNSVRNAGPVSRGRLDLTSGRIYDFHYNVQFWNSAIEKLLRANPALNPPPLLFPGLPHAGHAMAWLRVNQTTQRLEFSIAAQQFLPLGTGTGEAPLLLPASETAVSKQVPFAARNSSLHPFIFITAIGPEVCDFRPTSAPVIPSAEAPTKFLSRQGCLDPAMNLARFEGKTIRLICLSSDTNFGDDFALRSDDLGGSAMAQSPLFGQLEIQFGQAVAGHLPFVLKFEVPSTAFRQKFTELLTLLPPGTTGGLVGMCGEMQFPKATFFQRDLSLSTDPYKVSIGVVDLSNATSAPFVIRKYLFQNVMKSLLMIEPRTPTDSFAYLSVAEFVETEAGHIGLRLRGENFIPYPEGYRFPLPKGRATKIRAGSYLRPFVNVLAVEETAFSKARPNLRFVSTGHRRGTFVSGATLLAQSDGDGSLVVELSGGGKTVFGRDCECKFASIGDASVWMFDFVTVGAGKSKTYCHCVLTKQQERAELQLIAVDESLDFWATGYCELLD